MRHGISAGMSWEETRTTLLKPAEIAESEFRITLINEITTARRDRGLSRKQLAEFCGVRTSTISEMENGSVLPDLSTLFKILDPLGIRISIHS